MNKSIFDTAFIRAGQNGTYVETEMRKMRERSTRTRRAKAERKRWISDAKNARLPYAD